MAVADFNPWERLTVDALVSKPLFKHSVGLIEDRLRDRQAEGFGGLQVDDQLKFRWLLYGQIAGLGPLQNSVYIGSRPSGKLGEEDVPTIGHEAALLG